LEIKKNRTPYGSWQSPITSALIVAGSIGVSGPNFHKNALYWTESRPQEGGRNVLVKRNEEGLESDVNPAPFNIRTRVHEYGGGAGLIHEDAYYFSNFEDHQVYKQALNGGQPEHMSDEPQLRFADGTVDPSHQRIIYVVEDHSKSGQEAENYLATMNLDTGKIDLLTKGEDFYAAPALSPNGRQLAWITWQHPNMPWDETTLWLADINQDGDLENQRCVQRSKDLSFQQPYFSPDNALYYISDESGWWNIYQYQKNDSDINVSNVKAEFGVPHWVFGQCTYQFTPDGTIVCVYGINNESILATIDLETLNLQVIETPFTSISGLNICDGQLTYIGASSSRFPSVVIQDLNTLETKVIKTSNQLEIDEAYFSKPTTIEFKTGQRKSNPLKTDQEVAHGFYYPPTNKDFQGLDNELPPLLLMLHGGPTGATSNALSLAKQFWTSRGVAVLDLNYRGSTGYGRQYRDKLRGNWGITDVEDCVAVCDFLVDQQLADPNRLAIRGGSAGGYTTLCALTFTDTFKAGASHYGVSDLEALALDTHKFESRYLDSVVGPYPERQDIYRERSPIHHTDQLNSACIFFQGLEDKVVPPNQAEMMVKALEDKGLPVAYVPFEGEQHGFRQGKNIKRSLDLELYFYAEVFGFNTADHIEPIEIKNLRHISTR
jgi:dipeptidyl aminopeptidase/acylaminoacyl peptidase